MNTNMKIRTEEEFHAFRVEMEKLVAKGTALGNMELLNKEDKSKYIALSQAINKWEVIYGKFLLHRI
jgi:HTH-type transcriptional regulator/antitoxin HigA